MILKTDSVSCNLPLVTKQVGRYFKTSGKFYLIKRVDIAQVAKPNGLFLAEIEVDNINPEILNKESGRLYSRVYGVKNDLVDLVAAAVAK